MTRRSATYWICGGLLLATAPAAWSIEFSGTDLQGLPCTGLGQGYGPFDYTNPDHVRNKLGVVEAYHFTADVERLIKGKSGSVLTDLDYTLRAFPNHHRALFALIRYETDPARAAEKPKEGAAKQFPPPECYLQRALRFQPRDGKVQLLFGLYLHRLGKLADAETHYRQAVELMPRDAEAYYNLGLVLTDQKKFADAVPVAKNAYRFGYPLAGLRNRLRAAGYTLTD